MNAILKYQTPNIKTWPSEEDQREMASSFEDKTGFPGNIGAVDGTHIASKLASTYFTLFYRSVHVLYTGICILGGCLC